MNVGWVVSNGGTSINFFGGWGREKIRGKKVFKNVREARKKLPFFIGKFVLLYHIWYHFGGKIFFLGGGGDALRAPCGTLPLVVSYPHKWI